MAAQETAQAIQDEVARASALSNLAAALTQTGRFDQALLCISPAGLDDLLQMIAQWTPSVERMHPGLAISWLQEATEVAGWVRSDWREIHELLTSPKDTRTQEVD